MANRWNSADFCPKNAQCSMENGLTPSNGPKIQSMNYSEFPNPIEGEIREYVQEHTQSEFHDYQWMKCEGQLLDILDYTKIFSLLGNTYGGDARITFGLPDLRTNGETSYYICMNGENPSFMDM